MASSTRIQELARRIQSERGGTLADAQQAALDRVVSDGGPADLERAAADAEANARRAAGPPILSVRGIARAIVAASPEVDMGEAQIAAERIVARRRGTP
jgi:hypothetical protein